MNNELTLLEYYLINDSKHRLEIFKKNGSKALMTDYATLCGGAHNIDYSGKYWTSSCNSYGTVYVIGEMERQFDKFNSQTENYSIRPAVILNPDNTDLNKQTEIVEYGEYPQTVVKSETQTVLEKLYKSDLLNQTGKIYTTSKNYDNEELHIKRNPEYEYNNRKYVRVEAKIDNGRAILSNGQKNYDNDIVWVNVEPIKWLYDSESNILVSEKCLLSGIRFNPRGKFKCKYKDSEIKQYIDNILSDEITPSEVIRYNHPYKQKQYSIKKLNK
jgi:hypothetical protein